jgi:hypothetical protein
MLTLQLVCVRLRWSGPASAGFRSACVPVPHTAVELIPPDVKLPAVRSPERLLVSADV